MHKKFIMACVAIAAFTAFVIEPTASASPALTSNGSSVPVGTSIEYKNTGNIIFSGGWNMACSTAAIKATVTANTGTKIVSEVAAGNASFGGTGTGGDCTSALGDTKWTFNSKLCFETLKGTDNVNITGCTANVTFVIDVTSAGISCAYSTASATGTYVTSAAATVNLNEQPVTRESGQSGFCPASGSLTMDFDLYTTDGTPLTVS